jgi:hypothetical protein
MTWNCMYYLYYFLPPVPFLRRIITRATGGIFLVKPTVCYVVVKCVMGDVPSSPP